MIWSYTNPLKKKNIGRAVLQDVFFLKNTGVFFLNTICIDSKSGQSIMFHKARHSWIILGKIQLLGIAQVIWHPSHQKSYITIKSWKLIWNLRITQLKRKIIFQTSIFGFHVNFLGCKGVEYVMFWDVSLAKDPVTWNSHQRWTARCHLLSDSSPAYLYNFHQPPRKKNDRPWNRRVFQLQICYDISDLKGDVCCWIKSQCFLRAVFFVAVVFAPKPSLVPHLPKKILPWISIFTFRTAHLNDRNKLLPCHGIPGSDVPVSCVLVTPPPPRTWSFPTTTPLSTAKNEGKRHWVDKGENHHWGKRTPPNTSEERSYWSPTCWNNPDFLDANHQKWAN